MGVVKKAKGQMTIEFVVAFPAMIAVAFVAINAVLFLSDCAAFDRAFRNAVCTYASSPSYEQGIDGSCALVEAALGETFDRENLQCRVSASGSEGDAVVFAGELRFEPTLFGRGRLSGAFGVSFPSLCHEERMAVSVYKPGVVM